MGNRRSAKVKLRGKAFVDKIIAEYDDTISWEEHDSDIIIFIPEANKIFGTEEKLFDVPKGKNIELKVMDKPGKGEKRSYFYAVFHKDSRAFAESNSNPEIIIQG
ncbi:MAG: hypothetical protein P8Z35_01785 [Ignavibacteriaceae bacterium]|jgi:hypothetical protein